MQRGKRGETQANGCQEEAIKEVEHGRIWSISGFKMRRVDPSPDSAPDSCSFEEIKENLGRDGLLVLWAIEAIAMRSHRRKDGKNKPLGKQGQSSYSLDQRSSRIACSHLSYVVKSVATELE